jgi:Nucleotide modification associated domain 3
VKAILVRIGVDQTFGAWNAPIDADGRFVYVPIPEKRGTLFHPGLERRYGEVLPSLESFCGTHRRDLFSDLRFPRVLMQHAMHLDPDFDTLTYGDDGARRGAGIREMHEGDLLVFYGGLRPIHDCECKLIYALLGLYVVAEVLAATSMPAERWHENAHVRKQTRRPTDIVVRAKPRLSGRFERCIPIGEWRDGAYRVRKDVLNAWGGLSVRDGYIQRSAVPPQFHKPARFLKWLDKQAVRFSLGNNCHSLEPRASSGDHPRSAQANCVIPGMATGATSIGPQS